MLGILLLVSASVFLSRWEHERNLPKTWISKGVTPPPDLESALALIRAELAFAGVNPKRFGGVIEWVDGPFMLGNIKAAGAVMSFETPLLKLTKFDKVWESALAHEMAHVYLGLADGDEKLYKWTNETNAALKSMLS